MLLKRVAGVPLAKIEVDYGALSQEHKEMENTIILYGKCSDGGWENVAMNIVNITDEQRKLWEEGKNEIKGNTNFCHTEPDHLTSLGWI